MNKNLTSNPLVTALCAVIAFSLFGSAARASSNRSIVIDERGTTPIITPIMYPGGDPLNNPGSGIVVRPAKDIARKSARPAQPTR